MMNAYSSFVLLYFFFYFESIFLHVFQYLLLFLKIEEDCYFLCNVLSILDTEYIDISIPFVRYEDLTWHIILPGP